MSAAAPVVAGVELGGTKCIAVMARGRQILDRKQWQTGDDPDETLGAIADWLSVAAQAEPFRALGIGSFGPLRLDPAAPDYGAIVNTPKPGWSGANLIAGIANRFDVPVGLDTDVAGAALAEGRWGAAKDCAVHVYLTIGTGIGGGIVIDGKPLHGAFHPELGHVRVRRAKGDDFGGICPIHGDCLEGLASGPAIAARAGVRAEMLTPDNPVWQLVARDIAELMGSLILTLSPQRIVIGGGVGQGQPRLLADIRNATVDFLGGYMPGQGSAEIDKLIVPPALGGDAGVYGAIALGLAALKV
ncbi:fructokinase [Novosphingobium hassiacum]|uniref:fructokinase n=1 Tax=Novosphingobium hassiacum TaxID=173676 RepID=A0A7W5ZWC6_9SPHN|nr:ROK family protein [Novosphingobium hassiacum]MBB3860726.1 fructokinase [Novosphingobium hassiacum]